MVTNENSTLMCGRHTNVVASRRADPSDGDMERDERGHLYSISPTIILYGRS